MLFFPFAQVELCYNSQERGGSIVAFFSVLSAAIAPGIALLAYFYLKDRYDTEPFSKVAGMFLIGILIVIPILFIQQQFNTESMHGPLSLSFLLSAGLEEFMKWMVLIIIVYRHPVFDEPYDGIVYAVAVSLGFATVENILYAWVQSLTFSELLIRAFLPVSGHALFGVMMGYYLGKAKFMNSPKKYLIYSLLLPVIWHGLFDYILITSKVYWAWIILPFMVLLWIRGIRKVNTANNRSPFRIVKREEEVNL